MESVFTSPPSPKPCSEARSGERFGAGAPKPEGGAPPNPLRRGGSCAPARSVLDQAAVFQLPAVGSLGQRHGAADTLHVVAVAHGGLVALNVDFADDQHGVLLGG